MRFVLAAASLFLLVTTAEHSAAGEASEFTREEVRSILQHGPWPSRWSRDPSNRVSGKRAAIELGEQLFFDPRLAGGGAVSCASCHVPAKNFTDGRKLGFGVDEVERNTPTVVNVRYNRWFGWDGGNDNLWAQSLRPLLDVRELATTEDAVAAHVRNDALLNCGYRRAFGDSAAAEPDETVFVNIGKALAAYQETLVSGRTPFDDFRDALQRGDRRAMAQYPADAKRGLRIFVGRGACSVCHFGPGFSNGEFHETGVGVLGKRNKIDWGRYQGIKMLKASRFNLEGQFNDDPARSTALSTRHVSLGPINFEQFRVPALRNVALTAPYMHNGSFESLKDVVRHYSNFDPALMHQVHLNDDQGVPVPLPPDTLLKPLKLSDGEIDDVVAFLNSLTEIKPAVAKPRARAAGCR